MSEYQLELKQLVSYPRCRIYRQFIQSLISDRNIRVSGGSGLFHYTVLSCYANFRTSYRRIGGICYTIFPGEWLCSLDEMAEWFRVRFRRQVLAILKDLQDRHLIQYTVLGHGKLVKYRILGWQKHNLVLEYNAPCQKDTGFFFLPVATAAELIGAKRPSEMDVLLDLWINTVYNEAQVQGSEVGPVVYMRNGTGSPLISYAELARRWGISKATVGRYLSKLSDLGYITCTSFPGTHGSVIYLQNYLSTMFQISDVMLDKDEIAMALNIKLELDDSVANSVDTVSNSNEDIIVQKVEQVLFAQGFPCLSCSKIRCKLLPLSDGCGNDVLGLPSLGDRFLLEYQCDSKKLAAFTLLLRPVQRKEIHT